MKLGVNLDISSFSWAAFGSAITIFIGWIISFLKLRKDERVIEIENITKERKEWRTYLRKWLEEVSSLDVKTLNDEKKLEIRAQFISRINLIDRYDRNILELLDKLLESSQNDIINSKKELQFKISLLLKHDWERVKNETKPFYKLKKSDDEIENVRSFTLNSNNVNTPVSQLNNNKLNANVISEEFDAEVTREVCAQVTLFPLFASVMLIFHIIEKNYKFNFDEKFIHWFFIICLTIVFSIILSGILDGKKASYWLKFNLVLIVTLAFVLIFSIWVSTFISLRGLVGGFIVITSIVASTYTVIAIRSLSLFFKKLTHNSHRFFAIAMILAIECFIIISVFSL